MNFLRSYLLASLLVSSGSMLATPTNPYVVTSVDVPVIIDPTPSSDCIGGVLFLGTVLSAFLTAVEIDQLITISNALEMGDMGVLALQKANMEKIYAKIKKRLDPAHAFGYPVNLSSSEERDMQWLYKEQNEMQAFYDRLNGDYVDRLKDNFKLKAAGHGALATFGALLTALCSYTFYQEMTK